MDRSWLLKSLPFIFVLSLGTGDFSDSAEARPFRRKVDSKYERKPDKFYQSGAGIEVGAGNYNGFSFRRYLTNTSYLQGMLGFRLFESQLLGVTDYIQSIPRFFPLTPDVTPYYGAGVITVFFDEFTSLIGTETDNKMYLGARLPIGASINVNMFELPFNLFAEITPGLLLIPMGKPFLGITLGIRYLF